MPLLEESNVTLVNESVTAMEGVMGWGQWQLVLMEVKQECMEPRGINTNNKGRIIKNFPTYDAFIRLLTYLI